MHSIFKTPRSLLRAKRNLQQCGVPTLCQPSITNRAPSQSELFLSCCGYGSLKQALDLHDVGVAGLVLEHGGELCQRRELRTIGHNHLQPGIGVAACEKGLD